MLLNKEGVKPTPPKNTHAIIFGITGLTLSPEEYKFFSAIKPLGFILFKRNIDTPEQVKALNDSLREAVGWHCPILIDQEGGRVQRLRLPKFTEHPALSLYGDRFEENQDDGLTLLNKTLTDQSIMLSDLGFTVNCSPCLDVRCDGAHDIIGDRAFSNNPNIVAQLGQAACLTLLENNIQPVIKHMPGHGRALCDSHESLPVINENFETLSQTDFLPFKEICSTLDSSSLWGMSAHILFPQLDADLPATLSPTIIKDIIRGHIGFKGFLLGDDVFMKALAPYGDLPSLCAQQIKAGIDAVSYCFPQSVEDMSAAAKAAGLLSPLSLARLTA